MPVNHGRNTLKPYWTTSDGKMVRLYHGHVLDILKQMQSKSVHCCVTSPPYWGLRDYKTGFWLGGDPDCDHIERTKEDNHRTSTLGPSARQRAMGDLSKVLSAENAAYKSNVIQYRKNCGKCGAIRQDQQLGSESISDCRTNGESQCGCYICNMVEVFMEVYRVLRDDGTFWLNIGDTYGKDGSLCGVPWRLAFALQSNGWIFKSDIPWVKRSCMPESVMSRPNKSLEYVFMFSKQRASFFDMFPIRQDAIPAERDCSKGKAGSFGQAIAAGRNPSGNAMPGTKMVTGDKRQYRNSDLWFQCVEAPFGMVGIGDEVVGLDVGSGGYKGSHYAVFPPKLVEPCILAGTSEKGCCPHCGSQWKRITTKEQLKRDRPNDYVKYADTSHEKNNQGVNGQKPQGGWDKFRAEDNALREVNSCANSVAGVRLETIGWEPTCNCEHTESDVIPCTVLDPFIGSGTTCDVALTHGRRSIGIDLSETYLKNNAIIRVEGALQRSPNTKAFSNKKAKRVILGTGNKT